MVEKPVSPHLQIYKLPLVAILSITHRMSGAFLYFGLFIIIWGYFILSNDLAPEFVNILFTEIIFTTPFFMAFSAAIYYHLCNGIRHLFWDIGKGFDLKIIRITNYLVIFTTVFLFFASWVFILL